MPEVESIVEDVLAHHGVKGMKWGSRKGATGTAVKTPRMKVVRPDHAPEYKHLQRVHEVASTHKSTSSLSNKELQDAITRMNLQQQYSKMSGGKDKTRAQKGAQFISEMIKGSGKQQAQQALNKGLNNQINSALKTAKVG